MCLIGVSLHIRRGHVAKCPVAEVFSAAHIHTFRLIEFSALRAVVAEHKAVLHRFQREINTPVFSVDRDFGVIVKGGVRAEIPVHIVDQRLFHIGGVGEVIVQDQLIQTEAGLSVYIVVKFQLEAVAVCGGVAGNGGQAGVALGPDGDTVKGRAVDLYITLVIFLCRGVGQHIVPVGFIHQNIDRQDTVGIKQLCFILHGNACISYRFCDLTGKRDCTKA